MSQPNREDARDAFCALLASLAEDVNGSSKPFRAILNADPSGVDGRGPLLLVFSAGSRRRKMALGSSDLENSFRIEASILVPEDTPSWNDMMDDCEQAIAEVVGNTANRVTANWFDLDWENSFSVVIPAAFNRHKYMAESTIFIITVMGS